MIASDSPSRAISVGAGAAVAQRVDDPTDVLDLRHAAAEAADLAAHRGVGQIELAAAGGADDEDDRRVGVVAERVAEQPRRLLALRSWSR